MDNLSDFYKAYGQSLATRLSDHLELPAPLLFVFVEDVDDPKEILSYLSGGRAPAGQPVFTWDGFEEKLDTGGRDNYHLQLQGSFSLLQKALDTTAKQEAYRQCQLAALKALALMLQGDYEGSLASEGIQVELRQVPLEKAGPISACWYGYGVQFSWTVPLDLTL